MEKLNVAIADDNERMLNLLGEIVESDKDLKLVGKARNGEDIYHIIRDKQPDVVLLDHAENGWNQCDGNDRRR